MIYMDDKIIVHYIYVNKHNKYDTTIPEQIIQLQKLYVNYNNLEFKIHTYLSLYQEIKEYNKEYAILISKINPLLPAFIADIGRIFVLWKYGGIYHDAHIYIDNITFLLKIKEISKKYGYAFETHPIKNISYACRSTNMAAIKNNKLFLKILDKQMINLQRIEKELICNSNKRHNLWKELGMVFLEILLDEAKLINPTFTMKLVPNNENFCLLWDIKNLPKFYNNKNMDDHWTKIQLHVPFLIL